MSRIYFHAEDDEAEVRGSERAYAGVLCGDLFAAALGLHGYLDAPRIASLLTLFPADHYLHGYQRQVGDDVFRVSQSIRNALTVGGEHFTATLNTAHVMGSDPVKLLARLHGQCEIHAFVEGKDRAWLAGIIERGRASKVLRADMGWESVVTLLRSTDSGPVVTSYSVCEQFPNRHIAGWTDDHDGDGWYDLPRAEQWRRAIDGLYADSDGLQIKPDTWADFYFGDGTTAFDLLDQMRAPEPA